MLGHMVLLMKPKVNSMLPYLYVCVMLSGYWALGAGCWVLGDGARDDEDDRWIDS